MSPEVFLASEMGFRGLQNPPLEPGSYRLHPKLFWLIPVNTSVRNIRFCEGESKQSGIDSEIQTALDGVAVTLHVWVKF